MSQGHGKDTIENMKDGKDKNKYMELVHPGLWNQWHFVLHEIKYVRAERERELQIPVQLDNETTIKQKILQSQKWKNKA